MSELAPSPSLPVPRIYVGSHLAGPQPWVTRGLCGIASGCCLAVLVTAAWLSPDPHGFGTHEQLGLAPCGMLQRTGIPCPACGMTTSFTWLVHGHPIHSFLTQPAGTLLCLLTAGAFWALLYVAVTGRPGAVLLSRVRWTGPLIGLMVWVLLAWAYKIAVVVMATRGHSV